MSISYTVYVDEGDQSEITIFSLTALRLGLYLQLLPDNLPGPPDLSLPHEHRQLGGAGAEDIII